MSLSASTLFHFRKAEDDLIDIFLNGFLLKYILEDVSYQFTNKEKTAASGLKQAKFGIPMICFYDIRLTQTKDHTDNYGHFAIGMTKEWGIKNAISPVVYYHKNSLTTTLFAKSYSNIRANVELLSGKSQSYLASQGVEISGNAELLFRAAERMAVLSQFYKPISGKVVRNGKEEIIYFYNEREWRYTPNFDLTDEIKEQFKVNEKYLSAFLYEKEFKNYSKRVEEERRLNSYHKLNFVDSDINYIILPNKSHLNSFKARLVLLNSSLNISSILSKIRYFNEVTKDY